MKKILEKIRNRRKSQGTLACLGFVIKKAPAVLTAYFIIGVIRLLRPIVFIRIGSLHADKIGPLISLPGYYLLEKDHGIQPRNSIDIFCDGWGENKHICNTKLLKMYKRVFRNRQRTYLFNGPLNYLYEFCSRNSIATEHLITTSCYSRDVHGLLEQGKIYLSFTEDEKEEAARGMARMEIKEDGRFVCMLNRDPGYLAKTFPDRDFNYHSFRNSPIQDYMPAAEELTRRNYTVVRMGVTASTLMQTTNPKIIEYAHRGFRTELLDIYLSAQCDFFITSGSGIDAVPWFFRRPEVYVNHSEFEWLVSWPSNCLIIFKKYWLKSEKRFMTAGEMIGSGAGNFKYTKKFEEAGIELVNNTPQEISDVVDEMDQRLKGTWQEVEGDEELQKKFWAHFRKSPLHGPIRAKIGSKFLRQNADILGIASDKGALV